MEAKEVKVLDEILAAHDNSQTAVIAIMQDIQKVYRYLPEEMLCYIARKLHLSEAKVYGVATFYENFSLEPKGKYVIKICDGTACHVRQSTAILEEIRKILGVTAAKPTTDDVYGGDGVLPGRLRPGSGLHGQRRSVPGDDAGESKATDSGVKRRQGCRRGGL